MTSAATILVCDDSRPVREFLVESVLRPAGYRVLEAANGRAGLELAREVCPDLILADLQMPGLTGLELKRALSAANNHTPLILITAEGSENIASEATLAGVASYLPKPVDVDVLMAAIEQALSVERLRRERAEALQALEKRVHQLETLQAIGRSLAAALDQNQVMGYVVEAAVRLTGADAGRLFLLQGDQLTLRAEYGPGEAAPRAVHAPSDDAVAAEAVHASQPVRLPDPATWPTTAGEAPSLYVPLRLRERKLGVLVVDTRASRRPLAEAEVGPLVTLADHAAIAIANADYIAELQVRSMTDDLTGVYNRRHLYTLAEREYERARRYNRPLAAVMLDIDHFKQVNDTYGHAAGDQVIAEVARRCRSNIRAVDILGRYGGEEFALILPETHRAGAHQLAERLRGIIAAQPMDTLAGPLAVTISLGVASLTPEVTDIATLINLADSALYAAKQAGRNRVASALETHV